MGCHNELPTTVLPPKVYPLTLPPKLPPNSTLPPKIMIYLPKAVYIQNYPLTFPAKIYPLNFTYDFTYDFTP